MIVEHAFVTTLESSEALRLARDFLERRGFVRQPDSNSPSVTDSVNCAYSRGHMKATRAKSIVELWQEVQVEWLRGRVTVAASIEPYGYSASGFIQQLPTDSPKAKLHVDLLMAIVTGLESLLASQNPLQEAGQTWDGVEQAIAEAAEDARVRRRNTRIVLWGSVLSLVFFVGVALVSPPLGLLGCVLSGVFLVGGLIWSRLQ